MNTLIKPNSKGMLGVAAMLLYTGLSAFAQAAFVLEPVAASTSMGELYPAINAINQSGLSSPYTSFVTDFDAYVGANPTAFHGFGANVWGAPSGVRSGNFDLSLGGTYLVSGLAFWSLGPGDRSSVKHFNISVSTDPSFSASTTFSGFLASTNIGPTTNSSVQVFSFAPTPASFVRITILDTWSSSSFSVAFNEVALRASLIPSVTIELAGTNVVLSWPTNAPGFGLQSAPNMGIASWVDVTNAPTVVGSNYSITLSANQQAHYYFRLKR